MSEQYDGPKLAAQIIRLQKKFKALEEKYKQLFFAAESLIEAMDYGQTVVEIDEAVDEIRVLLNELHD